MLARAGLPAARTGAAHRRDRPGCIGAAGHRPIAHAGGGSALRVGSGGLPLPGHRIRIADAAGRELPERSLGNVEFRGPSATAGYFRNPEATASLVDDPWLRTGGMGCMVEGELYLRGRLKDIIIGAGQHFFPAGTGRGDQLGRRRTQGRRCRVPRHGRAQRYQALGCTG